MQVTIARANPDDLMGIQEVIYRKQQKQDTDCRCHDAERWLLGRKQVAGHTSRSMASTSPAGRGLLNR